MKRHMVLALLLLLVVVGSACASNPAGSYDALAGTYRVTLTQGEISAAGAPRVLQLVGEGTWQMELTADGKAYLSRANDLGFTRVISAEYKLDGSSFTFQETGELPSSCSDERAIGSYSWTLQADLLTLALVKEGDGCDRRVLLSTKPWERQP